MNRYPHTRKKGPGRKHKQLDSRTVSVGKRYPGTHRPKAV